MDSSTSPSPEENEGSLDPHPSPSPEEDSIPESLPEAGGLAARQMTAPLIGLRRGGHRAFGSEVEQRGWCSDPALAQRSEVLLPRRGATLTVIQRYPDGVVALMDESGRRVLFLRLQEAFDPAWRPAGGAAQGGIF